MSSVQSHLPNNDQTFDESYSEIIGSLDPTLGLLYYIKKYYAVYPYTLDQSRKWLKLLLTFNLCYKKNNTNLNSNLELRRSTSTTSIDSRKECCTAFLQSPCRGNNNNKQFLHQCDNLTDIFQHYINGMTDKLTSKRKKTTDYVSGQIEDVSHRTKDLFLFRKNDNDQPILHIVSILIPQEILSEFLLLSTDVAGAGGATGFGYCEGRKQKFGLKNCLARYTREGDNRIKALQKNWYVKVIDSLKRRDLSLLKLVCWFLALHDRIRGSKPDIYRNNDRVTTVCQYSCLDGTQDIKVARVGWFLFTSKAGRWAISPCMPGILALQQLVQDMIFTPSALESWHMSDKDLYSNIPNIQTNTTSNQPHCSHRSPRQQSIPMVPSSKWDRNTNYMFNLPSHYNYKNQDILHNNGPTSWVPCPGGQSNGNDISTGSLSYPLIHNHHLLRSTNSIERRLYSQPSFNVPATNGNIYINRPSFFSPLMRRYNNNSLNIDNMMNNITKIAAHNSYYNNNSRLHPYRGESLFTDANDWIPPERRSIANSNYR